MLNYKRMMEKKIISILLILLLTNIGILCVIEGDTVTVNAEENVLQDNIWKETVAERVKVLERQSSVYVDDLLLDASLTTELEVYLENLVVLGEYYWIDYVSVKTLGSKITRCYVGVKTEYVNENGTINKLQAQADWQKLQDRLAKGEWKEIVAEKVKLLETSSSAYVNELSLDASLAEELEIYLENLAVVKGEYYWIDYVSVKTLNNKITRCYVGVKPEYVNEDSTINKIQAQADWQNLQERLAKGEWKEIVKERIYEKSKDVTGVTGFSVKLSDLHKTEARELENYIEELAYMDSAFYWIYYSKVHYDETTSEITKAYVEIKPEYITENGEVNMLEAIKGYYAYKKRISSLTMYLYDDMTDIERILLVHEWVVRETEYDRENYDNDTIPLESNFAEGLLQNGLAICSGYTRTIQRFLNMVSIDNVYVHSDPIHHTWNIVKVDDNYYHFDATKNDWGSDCNSEGFTRYKYFAVSDREIGDNGYYGWTTEDRTIVCDVENSFEGYIFRKTYSETGKNYNSFNYYEGYWYYILNNTIVKSKIDGTQQSTFKNFGENIVNVFLYKEYMYIATDTKVYKIDMENTKTDEIIFDISNESDMGGRIEEFVIKQEKLKIDGISGSKVISLAEVSGSIVISEKVIEIEEGIEMKLSATTEFTDKSQIEWVSTDASVVTVDGQGKIVALKEGKAIIVVAVNGVTDTCEINVKKVTFESDDGMHSKLQGLNKAEDGKWYYYVDGSVDTSYTGFADNSSGKWYVEKGSVTLKTTGLYKVEGVWYYISGSKVQSDYTGLMDNASGKWYVQKGIVSLKYNGNVTIDGVTYKISGSKVTGTVTAEPTAELKKVNGTWGYYVDGTLDTSYTGFADNSSGKWYVEKGIVTMKSTGLYKVASTWYYVSGSKVQTNYTGIAKNSSGTWYVEKGIVSLKYNGNVTVDGVTYKVANSKVTGTVSTEPTTELKKVDGVWGYYVDGTLDTGYTGFAENASGTWYVQKGIVTLKASGLYKVDGVWYYVSGSKVQTDYTGFATNSAGKWYVENGVVSLKYNGIVTIDGVEYTVVGSKIK